MLRAFCAVVLIFVAGCGNQAGSPANAQAAPQPQAKVQYVASSAREPFHLPSCEWAAKISASNKQTFATREAAIRAGHRPCKVCRP